MNPRKIAVAFALLTALPLAAQPTTAKLTAATADKFARLALACVAKEYPNKIAHVLNSPAIPKTATAAWLPIGVVTDKSDGKLAHLDGLNLSRAWMLTNIAASLPAADTRRPALIAAAKAHADSGLASVTGEHYEGGHWLGSFATYLMTR